MVKLPGPVYRELRPFFLGNALAKLIRSFPKGLLCDGLSFHAALRVRCVLLQLSEKKARRLGHRLIHRGRSPLWTCAWIERSSSSGRWMVIAHRPVPSGYSGQV